MAFQPVPDVAEFRLVYDRGGDYSAVNVFHVRDTATPWTATYLNTIAGRISTWWSANARPLIGTALQLVEIQYADIGAEFGVRGSLPIGLAGTRTGELLPQTAPCVVQWVCDPGGRPRRGYTFVPGAVETDSGSDAFTTTYADAVEAAYEALPPAIGPVATTAAMVIVSRLSNRKPPPAEGTSNTIQEVRVRQVIGSQQRRRRKVSPYRNPT